MPGRVTQFSVWNTSVKNTANCIPLLVFCRFLSYELHLNIIKSVRQKRTQFEFQNTAIIENTTCKTQECVIPHKVVITRSASGPWAHGLRLVYRCL